MAPTGPRNARPPTGPRGKRNATTDTKAVRGGGVNKRRAGGPTRIDKDGDLDMDAPLAANGASQGKSGPVPTGPKRRSTRSSTSNSRPPKPTSRAQEMIAKVLKGSSGTLGSRISAGIDPSSRHTRSHRPTNSTSMMTLKVEGLKNSKAATNAGGGLKDLEQFLIRKAESANKLNNSRHIRIKKVCAVSDQGSGESGILHSGAMSLYSLLCRLARKTKRRTQTYRATYTYPGFLDHYQGFHHLANI